MLKRARKSDIVEVSEAAEESEEGKPPTKRRFMYVAAAVLLLTGVGAGAYFYFIAQDGEVGTDKATAEGDGYQGEDTATKGGGGDSHATYVVAPFKEIIVNITSITANGQATSRFLKLNVALAYDPSIDGADRLDERRLFIRDAFVEYLRQLTEDDLRGSAGLARLRADLLHRARILGETDAPRELLIADMVIQ